MKFKTYTGITWSLLELTGLLEDEDSRVCFERVKKHLGLHPFHLTNLHAALNEILSSNLNSYDAEMKGFLLAYKNPKLLTSLGGILYDTCFIHVDIEADCYIFRPEVGCSLKGVINKKGQDHIGVLVHKAFNVSIPKPDEDEAWPGDNVDIGQEVRFVVTELDFTSRLPFIRGALNADNYLQGCQMMDTSHKAHNTSAIINNNIERSNETIDNNVTQVKAKRHKKKSFLNSDSENTSEEDRIQIKKQVKRKIPMETQQEEDDTTIEIDIKTEGKNRTKKSKGTKESKAKTIKMERIEDRSLNNLSTDNEIEDYDSPVSKRQTIQKSKHYNSQSDTTDEYENINSEKISKKTKNRLANLETKDGILKIKSETLQGVNSDSENMIDKEATPSPKKRSSKNKHLNNSNLSINDSYDDETIKSPSKKRSKKHRISESESANTSIAIKTERINESSLYINSGNEESDMTLTEVRIKKQKRPKKSDVDENETESESPKLKSPKKHSKKNSLDSTIASENVKIKAEKLYSSFEESQEKDSGKKHKSPKKRSEMNGSTLDSSEHMDENDENASSKKKSKKHARTNIDRIKIEPEYDEIVIKQEFEDIEIKQEKLDDYENENVKSKKNAMSSSRKDLTATEHTANSGDVTIEHEETLQNDTKHKKKKKKADKESKIHGLEIKTEQLETTNIVEKRSPKKSVTNYESPPSIETDDERKTKHNKSSSSKRKSRKSESGFDLSNIHIKVEKNVDDC